MGSETSKVAEALVKAQDRIAKLEAAVKVLAEYGGSFHGLSGPFKCWDSRRAINAFDAMQANQIAAAAVREAGR